MTTLSRAALVASWQSWIGYDNRPPNGPWWLQWLWTLLLCAGIALFVTLLMLAVAGGLGRQALWARWYGVNLVVSLAIGVIAHVTFDLTRLWFARPEVVRAWRPWQRTAYFAGVPFMAVLVGWPLGLALAGLPVLEGFGRGSLERFAIGSIVVSALVTLLFHQVFAAKARRLVAERAATEARLKLLQAQIEPHFLFNTLANVHTLIEHDAARARSMLGAFTDYLRASLGGLRRDEVTLADELALAEAYLRVQAVRMEERLRFSIEADEAVRRAALPPLLLQPLVENAVVHGLEPQVEGGSVVVRARREGDEWVVEVRDDGRGMASPSELRESHHRGAGLALDNMRERLGARFGSNASLTLAPAGPGTVATLRLPWAPQADRGASPRGAAR